jgi:hypothetical protein
MEHREGESGASVAEAVERVAGKIATSLVISGALIAVAIYSRPAPPRYEALAADGRIVRIDTRSGTVIACEAGRRCMTVLKRGQKLERNPDAKSFFSRRPAEEKAPAKLPAP